MPRWLFEQVGNDPNPIFALQSSLNWIQSVSFEVSNTHGTDPLAQYNSALAQIRANGVTRQRNEDRLDLGDAFGSLFRGLTFAQALASLSNSEPKAWSYPGAIVQWYYAVYNSLRAINLAQTFEATDTHAGLAKSINNLSHFLPHPFNMLATWQERENYDCRLPTYNHSTVYDLVRAFEEDAANCRGMIVQYLKGTTVYELDKVKERLRQRHRIQDFRSAANRALRDEAAPRRVNFLHCAFRYRGKANYRDAIFLAYGETDVRFDGRFVAALFNSARFANLMAFAYLRLRVQEGHWRSFKADIDENLRHIDSIDAINRFWVAIE